MYLIDLEAEVAVPVVSISQVVSKTLVSFCLVHRVSLLDYVSPITIIIFTYVQSAFVRYLLKIPELLL